jgi:hypothetical protein
MMSPLRHLRWPIPLFTLAVALTTSLSLSTLAQDRTAYDESHVGPQDNGRIIVPTNQVLTPAGRQVIVGGRPSDIALSPDGRLLAVLNLREVLLVNVASGEIVSRAAHRSGSFKGILFSPDGGRIYASTTRNTISVFEVENENKLEPAEPIDLLQESETEAS